MGETSDKRRLVRGERVPGRNYDLYEAPSVAELHADGVSSFLLGAINSRLDFHRVERVESGGAEGQLVEIREHTFTLVMPTTAFTEFIANAAHALRENQGTITRSMEEQVRAFSSFVNAIGLTERSES